MEISQNIIYINPTLKSQGHIRTIALDLDNNTPVREHMYPIMNLFIYILITYFDIFGFLAIQCFMFYLLNIYKHSAFINILKRMSWSSTDHQRTSQYKNVKNPCFSHYCFYFLLSIDHQLKVYYFYLFVDVFIVCVPLTLQLVNAWCLK